MTGNEERETTYMGNDMQNKSLVAEGWDLNP